ncbi:DNA alkylation repair protein [Rhodobacteraceae bacterium CCMM004]|nr:DNA alkylation repair protein [Rhodobacteraceae bacterium CCMM004]
MTPAAVVARLEAIATDAERAKLARYGIPDDRAMGIAMRAMQALARQIGRDHALALALWRDGRYEPRTVAVYVADPQAMTAAEMDDWAGDLDSWALCDTAAFHLFDRTPHAWDAVARWTADDRLYVRRAGLATLWGLGSHDEVAEDSRFADALKALAPVAEDTRDHVQKALSMAARSALRRGPLARTAAAALANACASRPETAPRRTAREIRRALA